MLVTVLSHNNMGQSCLGNIILPGGRPALGEDVRRLASSCSSLIGYIMLHNNRPAAVECELVNMPPIVRKYRQQKYNV